MSFNDKLQKLRKEKKYSQEELADMLDVTRQSVSKWESGQTYPEMDKLLAICKIFNCSLDELTNDEIKEIAQDKKNNFNSLIDSSLDFINKTYKMFSNMKFKDILKCLFTMFIVGIILLLFYIPIHALQEGFRNMIFATGRPAFASFSSNLFNIILGSFYVVLYVMIFVYIFKIGFLDKYEFIKEPKILKEEIGETKKIVNEKVKEIKPTTKDRDYPIFKALGAIVMFFIKIFLVLFSLPFLVVLSVLFAVFVLNIYLIAQGVFFFSIILFILFGTLGTILILEFITNILFNQKHSYKRMFITLLIGVAGLGTATGVMLLELSTFKYYDEIPPGVELITQSFDLPFQEDMLIYTHFTTIDYEIDETLTNKVILEIQYREDFTQLRVSTFQGRHHIFNEPGFNNFRIRLDIFIQTLKNREFYNYSLLFQGNIIVRSSSANIEQIQLNIQEYRELRQEEEEARNYYENIIYELQYRIWELEEEHFRSEEEKDYLRIRIEELQNELQELRERAQSILN